MSRANAALRGACTYVPQEIAFPPLQTAYEAVAFSANITLGRDQGGAVVRDSLIHSVLADVGLRGEVVHRPIGGMLPGGVSVRGLSGGERKRLALACALVTKPRLLVLDEITSGLDSELSLTVMALIKLMCYQHDCAAIVVIHQPRPAVFALFDRITLLAPGSAARQNVAHSSFQPTHMWHLPMTSLMSYHGGLVWIDKPSQRQYPNQITSFNRQCHVLWSVRPSA